MSNKKFQVPNENFWILIAKIIVFIVALYLCYLVLRPVVSVLLTIGFVLVKIVVFAAIGFFIIYLFMRLIFNKDLIQLIFDRKR